MRSNYITLAVLLMMTLVLSSCYSVMPIANTQTTTDSKNTGKTVIVYYDSSVGSAAIEDFIKKNDIEVLYLYNNIHGYALKLKSNKQRKALERTKGVLSMQDDRALQLE